LKTTTTFLNNCDDEDINLNQQTGYFSEEIFNAKNNALSEDDSKYEQTPEKTHKKNLHSHNATDSNQPTNPFSTTNANKLNEDDIKIELEAYRKEKENAIYDLRVKHELEVKKIQSKIDDLEDKKDENEEAQDKYENLVKKLSSIKTKHKTEEKELRK